MSGRLIYKFILAAGRDLYCGNIDVNASASLKGSARSNRSEGSGGQGGARGADGGRRTSREKWCQRPEGKSRQFFSLASTASDATSFSSPCSRLRVRAGIHLQLCFRGIRGRTESGAPLVKPGRLGREARLDDQGVRARSDPR